jgi:hypothetical protein
MHVNCGAGRGVTPRFSGLSCAMSATGAAPCALANASCRQRTRTDYVVWPESLLPATSSARIIAGDSLHRVSSPALSAPRPILQGPLRPAHFRASIDRGP